MDNEGGDESQEDPRDPRLYRRDTPHHLKHKRVNSPVTSSNGGSSKGGSGNSGGSDQGGGDGGGGEDRIRRALTRVGVGGGGASGFTGVVRASGGESFESWASELPEPIEVCYRL